jgi:predicted Zn-dependent protease with MMP-like domain
MAIVVEQEPTPEQRQQLHLHDGALLFGLYEGVPLPQRNGVSKLLPDKITLFQKPIEAIVSDHHELQKHIKHTLWHELAHYYGLDHKRIHELE